MAKKNEAEAREQKAPKDSKAVKKEDQEAKKPEESGSGFSPVEFFQGTKEELAKVVWPTRQQLVSESLAVILMVILSATIIYFVDKFFSWVATQVF